MHIPENYLSPSTCAVMTAAMVPVWTYSIKKVKAEIPKVKMPLLGIGAAFSFLGMMFNIPLPGGTTGHAVGGTLIAILTGSPSAGCIAVTIALLIQALLFGDGGILALERIVLIWLHASLSDLPSTNLSGKRQEKESLERQWVPMLELMWQHFVQQSSLVSSQFFLQMRQERHCIVRIHSVFLYRQ